MLRIFRAGVWGELEKDGRRGRRLEGHCGGDVIFG